MANQVLLELESAAQVMLVRIVYFLFQRFRRDMLRLELTLTVTFQQTIVIIMSRLHQSIYTADIT